MPEKEYEPDWPIWKNILYGECNEIFKCTKYILTALHVNKFSVFMESMNLNLDQLTVEHLNMFNNFQD